ncbi:MAG TPA: hypothetical protein VGJ06_14805 [Candidatus Acidoferrum sp.]|jgi:pimeloyl-ACP methyl ester carboxylesterase
MTHNDASATANNEHNIPVIHRKRIEADGVRVFYREAGDPNAPVVLLLHGFPASSFQYRELIPRLADPLSRDRARSPGLRLHRGSGRA